MMLRKTLNKNFCSIFNVLALNLYDKKHFDFLHKKY